MNQRHFLKNFGTRRTSDLEELLWNLKKFGIERKHFVSPYHFCLVLSNQYPIDMYRLLKGICLIHVVDTDH